MKMKITIFSVLFLAAASLGSALPQGLAPLSVHLPEVDEHPAKSFGVNPQLDEALAPLDLPKGSGSPIGSLTQKCQNTLLGIITDPEFLKCVPLTALVPLIPIVTNPTVIAKLIADPKDNFKTVEGPFIQFSTGLCAAPKCSKEGNDKVIKSLQDGCKDDIANKNPIAVAIFDVAVFYSPLRDTLCFTDKKSKKFCWDESLLTVFGLPKSPIKIVDGGLVDSIAVADPPVICTDCNKDIVSTFANFMKNNDLALQILASLGLDDKQLTNIRNFIAVKCGINYLDGKIP